MGLGVLGQDAARKLEVMGFDVAGWSRSPRSVEGMATFSGAEGLDRFLARTDILVCLLPLTQDTRGILNRSVFARLARDGRLGGPVVINAGRGGLQVEADILACLDDGTLKAATLDVFETEPLPPRVAAMDSPRRHDHAAQRGDERPGVDRGPDRRADPQPRARRAAAQRRRSADGILRILAQVSSRPQRSGEPGSTPRAGVMDPGSGFARPGRPRG